MTLPASPPVVGVPSCIRFVRYAHFHCVNERYVDAMTWMGALPLLIPAAGTAIDLHDLVQRLDGLMLTGSPSNVEPHLYEGGESETPDLHDPKRDATTLPLIRTAVEEGLPILAICRGIQELNVALGGTLTQRVQTVPGRFDHRSVRSPDMDRNYGPAHAVTLTRGGTLQRLLGVDELVVNSLHQQAIDRVARPLVVEATAPDGTIEAVSMPSSPGFVMGVQWHPEYKPRENPYSVRIFEAFADAVRARARRRHALPARAA
ncbi:MAG: gamma-glutamyl-gamma-aminobutyrate hydrolase family protein [Alphaproteobacteria bacterium]|nr:gamma-glutamyl-gamma-aminobutyrate hydrolase family protein [Alphaproteobacteria bacterium]